MNKKIFLCVGGDARYIYMSKALAAYSKVYTYGIDEFCSTEKLENLWDMTEKADVLVLPLFQNDRQEIDCRSYGTVTFSSLVPFLKKNAMVVGGRMSPGQAGYFQSEGFETKDYFKREELVIKNCIPTAEGALQIALQELNCTMNKSRVLIIGFGRVGKACGRLFKAVGSDVVCTARKYEALAEGENMGLDSFHLNELCARLDSFDVIINTVPAMILDKQMLKFVGKDTLIIDLASKPGGVDFDSASKMNKKVVHALSLPGRTAPETSGKIIAETIMNMVTERGD
ncbi:MAG: dipicolinate synthase subunit DpsA [Oscillospiraceae bacterium]